MIYYFLIFVCSAGLGLATQRLGLSIYVMYAMIVLVWLLAMVPYR